MLNTVALLIPVFLLLVMLEWYISIKKNNHRYTAQNISMNLTIGAIDQLGSLFYFVALYFVLQYVYNHFSLFHLNTDWKQWILAYIAVDFLSYWYHRWSHEINILWAGHITHHSSELFNFSNGFRTSLFQGINRIIFWAILPVFGFSPLVLVIILKVSGIYDFLQHTQYIPKLGYWEKIFISPSLHRVHHGKNDIYIDKNYGSTFVIWDKLFGTFQEETEPVHFGITDPTYRDNSPVKAIGYHYIYLWKRLLATQGLKNKVKLLLQSPRSMTHEEVSQDKALSPVRKQALIGINVYAIFQMTGGTIGLIALLVCKDFMPWAEFIFCAYIGLSAMVNSTLILSKNIKPGFEKREAQRHLFNAVLTTLVMLCYPAYYFLVILVFILASWKIITTHDKYILREEN